MRDLLTKLIGEKQEWRAMEARAAALPADYRVVYTEIKKYVFNLAGGDGRSVVVLLEDLLGLFETGAADGRGALEVTGDDVAGFCDDLLRNARTYTQDWREKLNRTVHDELGDRP